MNENAIVAWSDSYDGATLNCGMAIKLANHPWNTTLGLIGRNTYAYSMDLGANQAGQVFAAYMAQDSSTSNIGIYVRKTDIYSYISGWTVNLTQLSTGTNNAYPRIVCTNVGNTTNAAAIWQQYDGTNTVLQATIGKGILYPVPTLHPVTQNFNDFGVFREYYNTVSWEPSSDLTTVRYLVLRNGVLIGIVPASQTTMSIIDHNQIVKTSGSVTYGVAAIDSSNSQSEVVEVTIP
jgi:hypothetical protein